MSKKMFQWISIMLIAVFVLAACAPAATTAPTKAPEATKAVVVESTKAPEATKAADPTKPAATTAPAATAAPKATDAPKTVKIKLWHQWDGAYLKAIEAVFKDYEKAHPGVSIDLTKPESVKDALNVAIPAGQGPDIIGWANDAIGEQALKGNIVPLNDYKVDDAYLKGIYTAAGIAGVTYKGKIWGLPETMEGIALVYNKAVIKDATYLPKDANDFAGLLKAAEQFQKDNPGKTLICNQGFTANGDGDAYHVAPVFFGNGVPSYVDETGKVYMNTPEAQKGAQFLIDLSKFSVKEQSYDLCNASLKDGKVGMWWTGPWAIKAIEDNKIDYGIAAIGKPFVGIKTLMLSKNAVDNKTTDVAVDIIKYFTSADVQKKLSLINKTIPAQTAALADPEVAKLTAVVGFGKALAIGIPMSPSPFSSAQWGPVGKASVAIWGGKATDLKKTLDDTQKAIEKAIADMK